jgi:hypothetical protein
MAKPQAIRAFNKFIYPFEFKQLKSFQPPPDNFGFFPGEVEQIKRYDKRRQRGDLGLQNRDFPHNRSPSMPGVKNSRPKF